MGHYNNLSQTSMSQIIIILVTMTLTLAMMTLRRSVMSKVKTSSRHHSLSNPGVNVKNIRSPLPSNLIYILKNFNDLSLKVQLFQTGKYCFKGKHFQGLFRQNYFSTVF